MNEIKIENIKEVFVEALEPFAAAIQNNIQSEIKRLENKMDVGFRRTVTNN